MTISKKALIEVLAADINTLVVKMLSEQSEELLSLCLADAPPERAQHINVHLRLSPRNLPKVCTCGGKKTKTMCSDWCDSKAS